MYVNDEKIIKIEFQLKILPEELSAYGIEGLVLGALIALSIIKLIRRIREYKDLKDTSVLTNENEFDESK